jgi:hypothetical protein
MRKGWLIGCGVIGVLGVGLFSGLVVLLIGGVFALTRPVVDASEQFLVLLGQGKTAEAYASAADGFRAQQDEASFAAAVKQLGLADYASASWHTRRIENFDGAAEGTVTTKKGVTKPVAVRLVREGGKWAVVGVRYGGVDLVALKSPPRVPPAAEVERMVTDTLLAFNQGVLAKDFTNFYGTISDDWKKQITPERIKEAFHEFLDDDTDIGSIKDVKPQFASPPAVNDKGVLVAAGHYPTQPARVRFQLEYEYERTAWKLTRISVNVSNTDAAQK